MSNNEGVGQAKEIKSQEKFKIKEEQAKAAQEEYKAEQEKFKIEQENLAVEKRKLELAILWTRYKKRKCLILFLNIMVGAFSLALIAGGIWVFCSIKEAGNPAYNWVRLIFGSVMSVSFVVLIIALSWLIKKLVSDSEEE